MARLTASSSAALIAAQNGQVAAIAPSANAFTWGTLTATNGMRSVRFVPARSMRVTKIRFMTTVAASLDDAVDVGIYNAAGTRLGSSGATTGKANAVAGTQDVTLTAPVDLVAGTVYYLGFAYGVVGGTAATIVTASFVNNAATQLFGAALGTAEATFTSSGTCPPTITYSQISSGYVLIPLET